MVTACTSVGGRITTLTMVFNPRSKSFLLRLDPDSFRGVIALVEVVAVDLYGNPNTSAVLLL